MNNIFRGLIAGYGAAKLGGGCFGTILVFILIWVALGQCSLASRTVPPPETYPAADRRVYLQTQPMFNDIVICDPTAKVVIQNTISTDIEVVMPKEIKTESRIDASIFPSRKIYLTLFCISFS